MIGLTEEEIAAFLMSNNLIDTPKIKNIFLRLIQIQLKTFRREKC